MLAGMIIRSFAKTCTKVAAAEVDDIATELGELEAAPTPEAGVGGVGGVSTEVSRLLAPSTPPMTAAATMAIRQTAKTTQNVLRRRPQIFRSSGGGGLPTSSSILLC